uniref:Tripartite motif containing 33 n=1 Tax=Eptatretus burgeri TaxID=7764 RepID=A0A8C4WZ22_EPTBU
MEFGEQTSNVSNELILVENGVEGDNDEGRGAGAGAVGSEREAEAGVTAGEQSEQSRGEQDKAEASAPLNLLEVCAVCRLGLQTREPKLLPCLHSFCQACLPRPQRQQLCLGAAAAAAVNGADVTGSGPTQELIHCPVCRQVCQPKDIVDNYFVKDGSESQAGTDNSIQPCTCCEDGAYAEGFCTECSEWLCKTCIDAHQRVKFTKDHLIRQKDEASQGPFCQKPVFCPYHKQEPLKLFCETCDRLTCRDCQLLEHKEHRYQFIEEAFQHQVVVIETLLAKLQEKRNYVQYSSAQVQNRLNEVAEVHGKVEHDIKVSIFTLVNEINKKGKALLQQLEAVTKERQSKLQRQQKEVVALARHTEHILSFARWAVSGGNSTALLYSKRLITYQLRNVLRVRCDPAPVTSSGIRFHCDPSYWAKNVINLGTLLVETPPPSQQVVGLPHGPPQPPQPNTAINHLPGPGAKSVAQGGQINLAQLRLQHLQQQAIKQQQLRLAGRTGSSGNPGEPSVSQGRHPATMGPQRRLSSGPGQGVGPGSAPEFASKQPPGLISLPGFLTGRGHGPTQTSPLIPTSSIPAGVPPVTLSLSAQPTRQSTHNAAKMIGLQRPPGHNVIHVQVLRQNSNPASHGGPFAMGNLHGGVGPPMPGVQPPVPRARPAHPIPSVSCPEGLPCLPDIPQIQFDNMLKVENYNNGTIARHGLSSPSMHFTMPQVSNPSVAFSSPVAAPSSHHQPPVRRSSTGTPNSSPSPKVAMVRLESVKVKVEAGLGNGEGDGAPCNFSNVTVKLEGSGSHSRGPGGRGTCCLMNSPENVLTPPPSNPSSEAMPLAMRVKEERWEDCGQNLASSCSVSNRSGGPSPLHASSTHRSDTPSHHTASTSSLHDDDSGVHGDVSSTPSLHGDGPSGAGVDSLSEMAFNSDDPSTLPIDSPITSVQNNNGSICPDISSVLGVEGTDTSNINISSSLGEGLHENGPQELSLASPKVSAEGPTHLEGKCSEQHDDAPSSTCNGEGEEEGNQTITSTSLLDQSKEYVDGVLYCAVCGLAGEMYTCSLCFRHFHGNCHLPLLRGPGCDWECGMCSKLEEAESSSNLDMGLSPTDQRKCERLLLSLLCCGSGTSPRWQHCFWSNRHAELLSIRKQLEKGVPVPYSCGWNFITAMDTFLSSAMSAMTEPQQIQVAQIMCTHFCEQVRELFPDINSTLLSTSAQLDALHISFQRNPESREPLVSKVF